MRARCTPQIEERELKYYTSNANTVGTQAALLAGFAFTGIVEAPWDFFEAQNVSYPIRACCALSTLLGMLFEILCIVKSVQISILGPGLALRGSEGSMTRALSVMRLEQRRLHWQFYIGLLFFHLATGAFCTGLFWYYDKVTAIMCISCLSLSFLWMVCDCKSVATQLWLPPAASLWKGEVDRRPADKRSPRCSCTGAVGDAPTITPGRKPAGATSPAGGLATPSSRLGPKPKPTKLGAIHFNPITGKSFRLPRSEEPLAAPAPTLDARGRPVNSDEFIVRSLISATMRDWTAQQAVQWHRRGNDT